MAITIDYATKIIDIPQSDLTLISGTLYELDVNTFRQELNSIMASEEGIWADTNHQHNTEVTIAGVTFARTVEIINGYSVRFTPDAQYTVRLTGANNNLFDVENGILQQNQVQVISNNSAGLIKTGTEEAFNLILKILRNKMITDPSTGTATIFDDDGTTVLLSGIIYEDAAGTQTYRGDGAERRERLE